MSAASILLHSGASVSAASASVAASVAGAAYLVAALLFILSLHGLRWRELLDNVPNLEFYVKLA